MYPGTTIDKVQRTVNIIFAEKLKLQAKRRTSLNSKTVERAVGKHSSLFCKNYSNLHIKEKNSMESHEHLRLEGE